MDKKKKPKGKAQEEVESMLKKVLTTPRPRDKPKK